jgi:hypothetical protein
MPAAVTRTNFAAPRVLVETKALEGSRGRYRPMQPLQALQVPPTVQTILAARIDRLSPEDKRLLQTASVVGKDAPFALHQAIAEIEALRGGLNRLRASELRRLVAHGHLGLGKLYRRTDERERALEHLATATTTCSEMGMTYWLEKAEAETRKLR